MEKGRAMFSVAHDPTRVFVVATGSINIQALGTKFNVDKLNQKKVSVVVTEGKVKVTKKEPDALLGEKVLHPLGAERDAVSEKQVMKRAGERIVEKNASNLEIITVGEKIIIHEQENSYQIKPVDIEYANTWRNGRLYFNQALLSDVLNEVNIYLKNKIVIGDSRLNNVKINMNFDIQDCKYFLSTLKDVVPIEYYTKSDNQIVISIKM